MSDPSSTQDVCDHGGCVASEGEGVGIFGKIVRYDQNILESSRGPVSCVEDIHGDTLEAVSDRELGQRDTTVSRFAFSAGTFRARFAPAGYV